MKKIATVIICLISVLFFTLPVSACDDGVLKLVNVSLAEQYYAVAVAKNNPDLKEQINSVLDRLLDKGADTKDGKVTFDKIYNEETAAVKNGELKPVMPLLMSSGGNRQNEFVVATNVYEPPFAYIVDTSFGGIDIRIAKIIADELGKELVVLHMDHSEILNSVADGTADAAISALSVTSDSRKIIDFSKPYYTTYLQIAVATDDNTFNRLATEAQVSEVLEGLENVNAGAVSSRTGYTYLTDRLPEEATVKYNTIISAVRALVNGEINIVCADRDLLLSAMDFIS